MNRKELEALAIQTLANHHAQGEGWVKMGALSQEVSLQDTDFLRRYQLGNKALSFLGIRRPETPSRSRCVNKVGPILRRLEYKGVVEAEWHHPPGSPKLHVVNFAGDVVAEGWLDYRLAEADIVADLTDEDIETESIE